MLEGQGGLAKEVTVNWDPEDEQGRRWRGRSTERASSEARTCRSLWQEGAWRIWGLTQ